MTRSARAASSVVSGLALAAAFPKVDLNLLAWVAFIPLFYVLEDERLANVFRYAWLQGFACYVASLYWIAETLHNFTSLQVGLAIAPMLLLAGVIALFTASSLWVAYFVARRLRIPIVVTIPIAWIAGEWLRTWFPIGFPWNLLGYTAYRNLELIQFAEFTGVYGVSALVIFANAVIYLVAFRIYSRRTQAISLAVLTALMASAFIFGSLRIRGLTAEQERGSLKVAMVQGDIPQSLKWDPGFLESSFSVYATQTAAAASRGADLTIWPEAAATFFFQPDDHYPSAFAEDARYRERLLKLARDYHEPILFGAPALGVEHGRVGFYNRAYLVSGGGTVVAWYDKIHLVPFGEYVPLRALLGTLVSRVVKGFGDMFPGTTQTIFQVKDAKLGVLICYESIFPDLARKAADQGAEVLINITNDAWYGRSSAPYQLLAMAAMRSVETKLPLVRVANSGISAIIEPSGLITATTALFTRGTETERVYWRPERTVYARVGDLFAETLFALTIVGLLMAFFRPRGLEPREVREARSLSANGAGARTDPERSSIRFRSRNRASESASCVANKDSELWPRLADS